MIRVSKNRLYACVFTATIFSFLLHMNAKVYADSSVLFSCDKNRLPYRCGDGKKHIIGDKVYQFIAPLEKKNREENSLISSAVIGAQEPNTIIQAMRVQVRGIDGLRDSYGVVASRGGKVVLNDSTFKNISIGLRADDGIIEVNRGEITTFQGGVYAEKQGTSVILANSTIKIEGQAIGQEMALFSGADANIQMISGSIDVKDAAALYVEERGRATLDGLTIRAKSHKMKDKDTVHAVFNINKDGSIHLKNTDVIADNVRALWIGLDTNARSNMGREGSILVSRVNIEDSKITVRGNEYGIDFDMDKRSNGYEQGIVFLKKTIFEVPDGTAIYNNKSNAYIAVTTGTKISGDLLLTAEKKASVAMLVDSSSLVGGTRVTDDSLVELYLTGGSKWLLTKRKENNLQNSNHLVSSLSFLKLSDSVIAFDLPISQEYQVLHVGGGGEEVYSVENSAHLYLNTHLNDDGSLNNHMTDRLLIHGDVSGKTIVHVQFIKGNHGEVASNEKTQNISLIQVSGKAAEDSFVLSHSYIALEGLPYKYYLRAYGSSSSLGKAHPNQRLVKGDGEFWDFRLENKYIQSTLDTSVVTDAELRIRDVVPQVPTYLLLPNFLFHTGLMDVTHQYKPLKAMQSLPNRLSKIEDIPVLFVYGYGGKYHYTSNLSVLEYGYGGNLDYNAIETGIFLKTIESVYRKISFGVMGTYGNLSLQPQNVEQSKKSAFHKLSLTAYGNMEHSTSFYVNGLLSYGLFTGDVHTILGKMATVKANPLNISLSAGKEFITKYEGFVFDPQIQLIYQYLQFYKAHDIDRFDIDIGNLEQWVIRIGGEVTKTFAEPEKNRIISLYGKIHFLNHFGRKEFVHLKDKFQLGDFGSSLEVGLGINSQLSSEVIFHGALNYQHRLTKAGFSGIRFSGGLRYRF
ncbi:autotransporter outer membrane beta-barrel domain-containing protein [Bartonella raoultii]|uniref:Autotransporter outer membrane beta-barrel domain-containing protein n=1 Tax=Bartonella raoultii TaxID=1457020 RepID=A0ABS7I5Y1_9HYPH|nr:autotransporter outer membrane beta-barrel domain-containing protein [Bartonella raoultii]MBX4336288.1 autotransporter outer membrane beta-barrel domain-containing protein [Bartonella raoultii]